MAVSGGHPGLPEVHRFFEERVAAVDAGRADTRDGLRHLAGAGLLGAPRLRARFELIRAVAAADLASAFSLWAHTMVLECLAGSSTPELVAHADRLRRATAWGSTAMAPAIKHLAGLGDLPVAYRRDGAELVLDGRVPWASNLFDDGVVLVLTARGAEPGEVPLVIAVDARDPSVRLGRPLPLLALGATASSDVQLRGARVTPDAVISSDLVGYMRTMKPRMLLLQTAYCLGLADAATLACGSRLEGAAAAHRTRHAALVEEAASLVRRAEGLVDALDEGRAPVPPDVVRVRLLAARAAQQAAELELRLTGGAAFVATSPTARRYREAAFLPVQTPTEGQLLTELG